MLPGCSEQSRRPARHTRCLLCHAAPHLCLNHARADEPVEGSCVWSVTCFCCARAEDVTAWKHNYKKFLAAAEARKRARSETASQYDSQCIQLSHFGHVNAPTTILGCFIPATPSNMQCFDTAGSSIAILQVHVCDTAPNFTGLPTAPISQHRDT